MHFPSLFRRAALSVVILVAATSSGFAQAPNAEFQIQPPSAWIQEAVVEFPAAMEGNTSGQDFLLLDQQRNVATAETYIRRTFQIVSESGRQSASQVQIAFDPSFQSLGIHHLTVVRNGQSSDRLDPARIQVIQQERDLDRQLYNGLKSALVILEDIRVGDVIDLAFTLKGENPVFNGRVHDGISLAWAVPVRDLRYAIRFPTSRVLNHRIHGSSTAVMATEKVGSETVASWRATNVPPIETESDVPPEHIVYPFLEVSDYSLWPDVARWAASLFANSDNSTPLVSEAVEHLKRANLSREGTAIAALDYVQREIRYLGIEMGPGSHQPSPPEEVLKRRFGDCKDKAYLLTAILKRLGYDANVALVHSSAGEYLWQRLPSPIAFDHAIVVLHFEGSDHLLDPTLSYQRGSTLTHRHLGSYGSYLEVGSRGLNRSALGSGDWFRAFVREYYQIASFEEPATYTIVTQSGGRTATYLRGYFANNSREQIGQAYLDYYTRFHAGISQASPIELTDDENANLITITERYTIPNLFQGSESTPVKRAVVQPGSIWDELRIPNLSQRRHPYGRSHPLLVDHVTTVSLPTEWPVQMTQRNVVDPVFSLFLNVVNSSPTEIRLTHRFQSAGHAVPLDRLTAFTNKVKEAQSHLGYELTWNPRLQEGTYPINVWMVGLVFLVFIPGVYASWRVLVRKNPNPPPLPAANTSDPYSSTNRKPRPEGLGGWLILVGFGLVLRPINGFVEIAQAHRAYFNAGVWDVLTDPASDQYIRHFKFAAPAELALSLALIVFSLLLIALFFRRSYLFPRTFQIFMVVQLAAAFAFYANGELLQTTTDADSKDMIRQILQTMLGVAIWVPYFSRSQRVKYTFVR